MTGGVFIAAFALSLRYSLMRDGLCLPYFGCNAGIFGYDGFLHILNGLALPFGFAWLGKGRVRSPLYLLSLVALVAVGWEAAEFAYDHIRIVLFHINLTDPNQMAQPTNTDTMGDLILETLGAIPAIISLKAGNLLECLHGKEE